MAPSGLQETRLRARSTEAECLVVSFLFTMSNSAVFFVPAARFCARVLLFSFPSTPNEGRAERRKAQVLCCRAVGARRSALIEARRVPRRRDARLSALHRGDFGPGAALPSPAFPPDPCSELLAARSLCLAGGVPSLPGLSGYEPPPQDATPRSAFGSSPETGPQMSEDK